MGFYFIEFTTVNYKKCLYLLGDFECAGVGGWVGGCGRQGASLLIFAALNL